MLDCFRFTCNNHLSWGVEINRFDNGFFTLVDSNLSAHEGKIVVLMYFTAF